MSPIDPDRIIIRRRPGGGRKPAPYSPAMAVSVSMSIDDRKRIDRAALAVNRTRSAFILRACYNEIDRLDLLDVHAPDPVPGSREQVDRRLPITVAERERRLDEGEDPVTVWRAFGDPTRGGRWNPNVMPALVDCVACPARIAAGAVYCPACGVEQPDALRGMGE